MDNTITFDSNSWKFIREGLNLPEDLECKFCNTKITKDTIGGICSPKEVFCKNTCCLAQYIMEQKSKQDLPVSKEVTK